MIGLIGYIIIAFLFFFYVFPFLIGKEFIKDKSMSNAIVWSAIWPLTLAIIIVVSFCFLIFCGVIIINDSKFGKYFEIGDFWNSRINKFKKKSD